mmetsp:Transcript_66241/g.179070  ORF Transcript_66241/g.179070 Transcript_66241/m.179070 type:complete len:253 (-) Transcript_66241:498-1256(-)
MFLPRSALPQAVTAAIHVCGRFQRRTIIPTKGKRRRTRRDTPGDGRTATVHTPHRLWPGSSWTQGRCIRPAGHVGKSGKTKGRDTRERKKRDAPQKRQLHWPHTEAEPRLDNSRAWLASHASTRRGQLQKAPCRRRRAAAWVPGGRPAPRPAEAPAAVAAASRCAWRVRPEARHFFCTLHQPRALLNLRNEGMAPLSGQPCDLVHARDIATINTSTSRSFSQMKSKDLVGVFKVKQCSGRTVSGYRAQARAA